MARHISLPATQTVEQLATWIDLNKIDTHNHLEQVPLTPEEIIEFEHASSLASRAIDKLKEVEKYFKNTLKKGTPYDKATENHKPHTITIPPSKGLDALTSNREFADKQIVQGYKEDITKLYLIPYPEESRMIMVDIVGVEWEQYSRDMTADEEQQYKPLLKTAKGTKQLISKGKEKDGSHLFEVDEEAKSTQDLPFE